MSKVSLCLDTKRNCKDKYTIDIQSRGDMVLNTLDPRGG